MNAQFEFVQFERFLQIVIGALFHGLHGRFDRAEPRDDNDYRRRVQPAGFVENIKSLRSRFIEIKVGDDELGSDCLDRFRGSVAIGKWHNLVPFGAEQFGDHLDHGHLVIGKQHFGHSQKLNRSGYAEQVRFAPRLVTKRTAISWAD